MAATHATTQNNFNIRKRKESNSVEDIIAAQNINPVHLISRDEKVPLVILAMPIRKTLYRRKLHTSSPLVNNTKE